MLKSNNKKSNMQKSIGKKATFKKSNSTIWTVFTKTRCVRKAFYLFSLKLIKSPRNANIKRTDLNHNVG